MSRASAVFLTVSIKPCDSGVLFLTHKMMKRVWRRERDSNPRHGIPRIHAFQACALDRSAISPETLLFFSPGRRSPSEIILDLRPAQRTALATASGTPNNCQSCRGQDGLWNRSHYNCSNLSMHFPSSVAGRQYNPIWRKSWVFAVPLEDFRDSRFVRTLRQVCMDNAVARHVKIGVWLYPWGCSARCSLTGGIPLCKGMKGVVVTVCVAAFGTPEF